MSRFQQFIGKLKQHQDDNSDTNEHAKSHRHYHHEQSNKIEVYHVAMTILCRVCQQWRVYDCSHNGQQIIT